MVEDMSIADLEPGQVTCRPGTMPDLAPMKPSGLARSAHGLGWTGLSAERPVALAGTRALRWSSTAPGWAATVWLREIQPW